MHRNHGILILPDRKCNPDSRGDNYQAITGGSGYPGKNPRPFSLRRSRQVLFLQEIL